MNVDIDAIALGIVLSTDSPRIKQKKLDALAKLARHAMGDECPACGCTDTEDNGCGGDHVEYRCTACDYRWSPA